MEIYLVRHTAPDVAKGVCYGQADIGVQPTFETEAAVIQPHLPNQPAIIYSSPLQRCYLLAQKLYQAQAIDTHPHLKEIDCGHWELQKWDDIPKEDITPWMNDFVQVRIPGGESYIDLYQRCTNFFNQVAAQVTSTSTTAVIFTHGGVIRSILSYLTKTPLQDSFAAFSLHYGCVIKLQQQEQQWHYQVLSNVPHEKETHKPSYL